MATLTATQTAAVEILEGVSYAPGVTAVLISGRGYWVKDLVTHFVVSADDGGACYTVRMGARGKAASCSCPDFYYRRPKNGCKHCQACELIAKGW